MHLNSKLLLKKYAASYFKPEIKVLEIGPDGWPSAIRELLDNGNIEWHTLDITDDQRLTYANAGEYNFPIADGQYDIVVSANVIEHVKKIWRWIPELVRVTKKEGFVITVNPVSWNYHAYPVDCWRIYPDGMKALYEDFGLKTEVSVFENLESKELLNKPYNEAKMWPGASLEVNFKSKKIKNFFGYPVTAALDTITIGKKL